MTRPPAEDRRELLARNLSFGGLVGAAIGLLQVYSKGEAADPGALLGYMVGGAVGGAVLFVLVSAIARWMTREK